MDHFKPNSFVFFSKIFFLSQLRYLLHTIPTTCSRKFFLGRFASYQHTVLVRVQLQALPHCENVMGTICVKFSGKRSYTPVLFLSAHLQPSSGTNCINRANFQAMMTAQKSWKKSDLFVFQDRHLKTEVLKLLRHFHKCCSLSLSNWSMCVLLLPRKSVHHWGCYSKWICISSLKNQNP